MLTEAEVICRLRQTHGPTIQAMSLPFDELIETAKAKSQEKKLANIDANAYLSLAQTNPRVRAELEWKIGEGVREQDFRLWWDTPDLERQFVVLLDFIRNGAQYVTLRKQGSTDEEAHRLVYRAVPSYIEFLDTCQLPKDADFPLPIELRDRVERRMTQERMKDPKAAEWIASCRQFTTATAYVRHEIAAGRL
jgi:hypothetical protein